MKKKLEEVEKAKALAERARDKTEQHEYEVGVAETENTLRVEVPAVCRTYYALTWCESLNQAGFEASSMLRKAKSVYYPLTICTLSSTDSKADLGSSEAG